LEFYLAGMKQARAGAFEIGIKITGVAHQFPRPFRQCLRGFIQQFLIQIAGGAHANGSIGGEHVLFQHNLAERGSEFLQQRNLNHSHP